MHLTKLLNSRTSELLKSLVFSYDWTSELLDF